MPQLSMAEYIIARRKRIQRRRENLVYARFARNLRDMTDPFQFSSNSFLGRFRLNKLAAFELINILRPFIKESTRPCGIPVEFKILTCLEFLAHGSDQRNLGGTNLGLSQMSVSRAIAETVHALNAPEVLNAFILFPVTREERMSCIAKNYKAFKIPRVVGFIDGTLVGIKAPSEHENAYFCRKLFHALNVQVVCDAEMRILNVNARHPGSAHDAYVWRCSAVKRKMAESYEEERQWLIGDTGYPLQPWLLTKLLTRPTNMSQEDFNLFNKRVSSARSVIERCFGSLKNRWRCIQKKRILIYNPVKAGLIVNACCVLHNFALQRRQPEPDEDSDLSSDSESDDESDPESDDGSPAAGNLRAVGINNIHFILRSLY